MPANGHRSQKWRDLPPVERPVSARVDENGERYAGVTFLRTHDRCDRAAYLDLLHEGGVGSHEMNRGAIFHVFAAMAINHLIANDEPQLDPETAKDFMLDALAANPDLTVPAKERDSLRAMAYNFARGTYFPNPTQTIVGVELSLSLRIGSWIVRGKLDLVEMPHFGRIDVTDFKTSFAMPTEEEWAGDFQTMLYALLLAFGEMEGGIRLAPEAREFGLKLMFPRYEREDGLARKSHVISREQLLDFRLDLEHQLARYEGNLETQKWPATPGSHCAECPSPLECPLPRHLRPDSQMHLATIDDAIKLAEWWDVMTDRTRRAKARLKKWADAHGQRSIPIGTDLELRFELRDELVKADREEILIEAEGAVEHGFTFDVDKYRERTTSTRFERRKVKK